MTKTNNQTVYEKMLPYAEESLEEISVLPGIYMGNKKCQHNARQVSETFASDVIVCLMFIPKSGVRVHFINGKAPVYVDNTLGYLSGFNRYFKIKDYTLEELRKLDTHKSCMDGLLSQYKEEMLARVFTPKELSDLQITQENI